MTNYKHVNLLSCSKGIPCGLLTCPACSSAWRSKWRAITSYGCHHLIDSDGYFLTLTAENLRPNEPNNEILFRLHESFYTFRKNFINRYLKGSSCSMNSALNTLGHINICFSILLNPYLLTKNVLMSKMNLTGLTLCLMMLSTSKIILPIMALVVYSTLKNFVVVLPVLPHTLANISQNLM